MTRARCTVFAALAAAALFPHVALAANIRGDAGYDTTFFAPSTMAQHQNLGNGNFTHGAAMTGLDIRVSATAGGILRATLFEHDIAQGGTRDVAGASFEATTQAGEHVYHFDLPTPFTPNPAKCYSLVFYRIVPEAESVYFGWANDTYQAPAAGCPFPYNSDDIPLATMNPSMYGHGVTDFSIAIYDDGAATSTPVIPEPSGKAYGDIGYDFVFTAPSSYAAYQNLGNGSFSEGHTVTGVDVRLGTVPGNFVQATISEVSSTGHVGSYQGQTQASVDDDNHVYHFELDAPFQPNPDYCYTLLFYQSFETPLYPLVHYAHTSDVYAATSSNCSPAYASDDKGVGMQNPSLSSPGYTDHSFRIITDGPTSTPATTTPACAVDCNSSVMFLPGIESSRLYRPDYAGGTDRLWEPNANSDVRDLFLNPDGTSARSDVYTKVGDVVDELPSGANIYKSFISQMDALKTQHKIADWQPISYDWRLSLDDILTHGAQIDNRLYYSGDNAATSTPYIIQELRRLAAGSRTGKVTIVAHSNGGLVAKRLSQMLGPEAGQLIDKMIFVAVPQAGTPMAVAAGMHGYDQDHVLDIVTSEETARTFASTSPMAYNLLPSASYFTQVDDPVISFDASLTEWRARYGDTIHSQERLHAFLTDTYGRVDAQMGDKDQPIQASAPLLTAAENMHASLDAWTPPPSVKLIQIAGWGVPTTLKGVTYKKKGSGVQPEMQTTIDGDGTVVVPSALWANSTDVENYWVDLEKFNKENSIQTGFGLRSRQHANIFEVSELTDFVSNFLAGTIRAAGEYAYIVTQAPQSTDTRLRYSLHSPLTLDLFDEQGRHTGVSTTTGRVEEKIPGTYYQEFGDVKYIFTDASSTARVRMSGYATSTFTFEVEQLLGDSVTASTTWQDMPVTARTTVGLDVGSDIHTLGDLKIDTTGDGVPEYRLAPAPDGIVTLPKAPLTLTAKNYVIALGSTLPTYEYTLTSFLDGDTASASVSGSAVCTSAATATSGVGIYPITCSVGTLASSKYEVTNFVVGQLTIAYRWDGFMQPINDTAHQVGQSLSVFKAGSTVPVKLQLKKADGSSVQAAAAPIWLSPQQGSRMSASIDESIYTVPGTSGNVFKWDASSQQYVYNWSTKGLAGGYWYKAFVKFDDGKIYSVVVGLK